MKVEEIKNKLTDKIGTKIIIKYNLGRNKYEKYEAIIKETYNHIFIVKLLTNEIKSFSYSDLITKTIKIEY